MALFGLTRFSIRCPEGEVLQDRRLNVSAPKRSSSAPPTASGPHRHLMPRLANGGARGEIEHKAIRFKRQRVHIKALHGCVRCTYLESQAGIGLEFDHGRDLGARIPRNLLTRMKSRPPSEGRRVFCCAIGRWDWQHHSRATGSTDVTKSFVNQKNSQRRAQSGSDRSNGQY